MSLNQEVPSADQSNSNDDFGLASTSVKTEFEAGEGYHVMAS